MQRDTSRQRGWLLVLLAAASAFAQDPNRPLRLLGEFSNLRFTEEHAYGYAVDLWRDGDSVVGLFLASAGLAGDTPAGALENVTFNARTGALSFTARLSTGVTILPGGGQEPTRDLFEFSGALQAGMLTGTLKRYDARQPARPPSREGVQLRFQPQQSEALPSGSYADWKRRTGEILKFRGPKW
jgi:hypothetical protein